MAELFAVPILSRPGEPVQLEALPPQRRATIRLHTGDSFHPIFTFPLRFLSQLSSFRTLLFHFISI